MSFNKRVEYYVLRRRLQTIELQMDNTSDRQVLDKLIKQASPIRMKLITLKGK